MRKSRNGGSCAVKKMFRWTLNGLVNRCTQDQNCFFISATASHDVPLSNHMKCYFNKEFNELMVFDVKMMPVKDKRAFKIFEDSAQLVKGHYQIAIPWKQDQPSMPDKKELQSSV